MMKIFFKINIVLAVLLTVISCEFEDKTPQKVFDAVAYSANAIPSEFKRTFVDILDRKKKGMLNITVDKKPKQVTAVEWVNEYFKMNLSDKIKIVQELKGDEESKPIIAAGLDLFLYADGIYKIDFPIIAKMIDDNKSEQEIFHAIQVLEETKGAILNKKYDEVMKMALPYADKHGVKYEFIDYGF